MKFPICMLNKGVSKLVLGICLNIAIGLFIYNAFFYKGHNPREEDGGYSGYVTGTSIFPSPTSVLDESLPHYLYKRQADSIQWQRQMLISEKDVSGSGFIFGPAGIYKLEFPQQITGQDSMHQRIEIMKAVIADLQKRKNATYNKDSVKKLSGELMAAEDHYRKEYQQLMDIADQRRTGRQLYFVTIKSYQLKAFCTYYLQNGKYMLEYPKWDSTINTNGKQSSAGHYEHKALPVRYETYSKQVMFPISATWYSILYVVYIVFTGTLIGRFLYIFFGIPIRILLRINKGDAFNAINVRRFNIMGLLLFGYALIGIVLSPFIHWLFHSHVPAEFIRTEDDVIKFGDNIYLMLVAIALLIIGRAFDRGHKLQQEQDLTI
jgi:hypothetical protein